MKVVALIVLNYESLSMLKPLLALMAACLAAGCGKDLTSVSFGPIALADKSFGGLKVMDSENVREALVLYEKTIKRTDMKPYQDPPKFEYGEIEYAIPWGRITVLLSGAEPVFLKLNDREVVSIMAMKDLKAELVQSRFTAPVPTRTPQANQ